MNSRENTHDVLANDRSFSSNTLTTGSRFTYTFQSRGRSEYFCTPHESEGMVGVIVVE
jgi:plastocyanin